MAAVWLATILLQESLQWGRLWFSVVFWAVLAYLVLPRLHRILTRTYLPGYIIGRARTSDGLLGDPVNMALLATEAQVRAAMRRAGWTQADDGDLTSSRRMVVSTLTRRSYDEAPVSPLFLFGRQQDSRSRSRTRSRTTPMRKGTLFWPACSRPCPKPKSRSSGIFRPGTTRAMAGVTRFRPTATCPSSTLRTSAPARRSYPARRRM